jgi:hypothetical protein
VLLRDIGTNDLANGITRQAHIPGDLANGFVISMVGKTYFTDSFHDQHLLKEAPLSGKIREFGASAEVGQFWTPITLESGSFLHAD